MLQNTTALSHWLHYVTEHHSFPYLTDYITLQNTTAFFISLITLRYRTSQLSLSHWLHYVTEHHSFPYLTDYITLQNTTAFIISLITLRYRTPQPYLTDCITLQNTTAFLDSSWPSVPHCFQQTVLIWLPCAWLWLTLPPYACYLYHSDNRERNIPANALSALKSVRPLYKQICTKSVKISKTAMLLK
jgi:hypothetical protein